MLNATNKENGRKVEMMFGKAVCAYANWMDAVKEKKTGMYELMSIEGQMAQERFIAMYASEYEATVRCLDLFVDEDIYEIQRLVRVDALSLIEH